MYGLNSGYTLLVCATTGALPWSDCPEPGSVVAELGFEVQQIFRQIQAAAASDMAVPMAAMNEWIEEAKKIGWDQERARNLLLGQHRFDS